MTERYDFTYWPPRPIEQPLFVPAQSCSDDELTRDVLYIKDPIRRSAVYATGDWADIQDFWNETTFEPKPKQIYAEAVVDPVTKETTSYLRINGRRHLNRATHAFHSTALYLCDDTDETYNEVDEYFLGSKTRPQLFLEKSVFNSLNRNHSEMNVLIARRALTDIIENVDEPWPKHLRTEGQVILAKVALRWHTLFEEDFQSK